MNTLENIESFESYARQYPSSIKDSVFLDFGGHQKTATFMFQGS
jgi:hypothetical protein